MPGARVIVVGAGMAGLTAAATLARLGIDTCVLEASDRVGGRMTTDEIDGFVIDRGAQFLSSAYANVLTLIEEVSLTANVQQVSPYLAVVRGGEIRRVALANPFGLVAGGLLAWSEWMRLGWRSALLQRQVARRSLSDYSAWADLDDDDAARWCRAVYGRGVTDALVEPVVEGLYFQSLDGMSRALPLALTALAWRRPRTLTLRGGIGTLPEAIAARLDVTLSAPVHVIETTADSVRVHVDGRTLECERVVLATTASVARRLYTAAGPLERELLATRYSSTVNVAVVMGAGWHLPRALRAVYGLFVPRSERQLIAAVGIESRKSPDHVRGGELLNVMVTGRAARDVLSLADTELAGRILPELERYFPALRESVRSTHCFRWIEAEPCSPPGRSRAIAAYRRGLSRDSRVVLTGDYVGMPFVEGAAEAGRWGALHVAASLAEEHA